MSNMNNYAKSIINGMMLGLNNIDSELMDISNRIFEQALRDYVELQKYDRLPNKIYEQAMEVFGKEQEFDRISDPRFIIGSFGDYVDTDSVPHISCKLRPLEIEYLRSDIESVMGAAREYDKQCISSYLYELERERKMKIRDERVREKEVLFESLKLGVAFEIKGVNKIFIKTKTVFDQLSYKSDKVCNCVDIDTGDYWTVANDLTVTILNTELVIKPDPEYNHKSDESVNNLVASINLWNKTNGNMVYDKKKKKDVELPIEMQMFLIEVDTVCRKYGLSISHEDVGGSFEIQEYRPENRNWLFKANKDYEEGEPWKNQQRI